MKKSTKPQFIKVYEETTKQYWFDIHWDRWNWRLRFKKIPAKGENSELSSLTYHATPPQLIYRLFDLLARIEVTPSKSLEEFERGVERAYKLVKNITFKPPQPLLLVWIVSFWYVGSLVA